MSAAGADYVLYVISIRPTLEDQLIDWLLARPGTPGFTSAAINGHSSESGHLSVSEQVSGKQRRLQFQVQLAASELEGFTAALAAEFKGADLHYWVVPLVTAGSLGASAPLTPNPS